MSNATEPEIVLESGTKAISEDSECAHSADGLELLSTNGLTYYYRCGECDGIVVVWRR